MADVPYLHGFTEREQQRLIEQSLFLEPWVYQGLDLSGISSLLEIGSGVGAQTAILLRKFPDLNITCIDHSEFQLRKAAEYLSTFPEFQGRYELRQMKGEQLDFEKERFDGVYFCWVLEHVTHPETVIGEAFRVLKTGGEIIASEVFNSTFYTFPEMLYIKQFWEEYNQFQKSAGGDPDIGAKLGNLLVQSGFSSIVTESRSFMADHRDENHKGEILNYWATLLLSAAPNLLESELIDGNYQEMVKQEFEMLKENPKGVFHCSFIRARGTKQSLA